jgi:ribose 5-phosphate isomerase B
MEENERALVLRVNGADCENGGETPPLRGCSNARWLTHRFWFSLAKFLRSAMLNAFMKIAIGSDHAGFNYKEKIKQFLLKLGHDVKDFGTNSDAPVDYPVYIRPTAEAVARGECERGIVLGGSGNGEAIVANRVKGVRCALCWNLESARLGRQHNNANVISIGERMVPLEMALEIVKTWLDTPFEGGRHQRRIDLIDAA